MVDFSEQAPPGVSVRDGGAGLLNSLNDSIVDYLDRFVGDILFEKHCEGGNRFEPESGGVWVRVTVLQGENRRRMSNFRPMQRKLFARVLARCREQE